MSPPVAYPVKDVVTKKEATTRRSVLLRVRLSEILCGFSYQWHSANGTCLMGAWCIDNATTISGATLATTVLQRIADRLFLACDVSCFADPAEQSLLRTSNVPLHCMHSCADSWFIVCTCTCNMSLPRCPGFAIHLAWRALGKLCYTHGRRRKIFTYETKLMVCIAPL
eukprot:3912052-Amphidinium_carterae.3